MSNKFKLKKKLVSIALALVLAAQPLASLPMNVFAGTGENGMLTAPLKADLKELNHGQQVSSKYIVQKSVDFSDKNVLSGRVVQAPGIVYAKEKVGNSMRDVYIIADINGMLNAASVAAQVAKAASEASYYPTNAAWGAALAVRAAKATNADADKAAWVTADAALAADANDAGIVGSDIGWYNACESNVDRVVSALVANYKEEMNSSKRAWLNAAYAAVKVVKKMSDGKELDLEAKLKIAYMAYRVAEAVWIFLDSNPTKLEECKKNADALQKVIDRMYSDKVGDIEAQAEKAQG